MKLKVLMFGWEFPPFNSGGLGTACAGLTQALCLDDAEVIFVLPKKMDVKAKGVKFLFAKWPDSKLIQFDSLLTPYLTPKTYLKEKLKAKKSFYGEGIFAEVLRYAQFAKEIAKRGDFDVIHAHDWLAFKAGIEAKKISGKPLIVHIHSTEFDRTGGNNINEFIYKIEKEGMEEADKVIAVSEFTKSIISQNYGIPDHKIQVIRNGINVDDYTLKNFELGPLGKLKEAGYKIVLFVGRLTVQKGPDYFIKAAKKVLEFNKKVFFLVVGSGDLERQIIQQAAELGISDKVLFAGFLRGDELLRVYKMADCFVLSSVSEPFGITALESIINNTPVILSKQSGVSEVLSHVLKVDFWDTDEMAAKILAVLNYDALHLSLKKNALAEIQKVSWQESAKQCLSVYREVLDNYFRKHVSS